MTPIPNSRDVTAITRGIARRLNLMGQGDDPDIAELAAGGGDANGSANQAHMMGQAGTAGTRVSVPRLYRVNYCGVV